VIRSRAELWSPSRTNSRRASSLRPPGFDCLSNICSIGCEARVRRPDVAGERRLHGGLTVAA
jgi:hypothetical protein